MLKLAWRNLWRNRTRTTITIMAIALAYTLYLIALGVQGYTFNEMKKAAAKAAGGDVLVQARGFQDDLTNEAILDNGEATLQAVQKTTGVTHAAPRVIIQGLLSTSTSSMPVRLQGVDPTIEQEFQDLGRYIHKGTMLSDKTEHRHPIALGAELCKELDLKLGDRVVLTATGADGEMRRALFHLEGILKTGSKTTDRALAYTTIKSARDALGHQTMLSQIGVIGSSSGAELVANLQKNIPNSAKIEVMTWDQAMPDLVGFIEMKQGYGGVFGVLLFVVVLFSILNTFLMIVFERIREFGLLGALGLNNKRVAMILLTETAMLALVSVVVGLLLALLAHTLINIHGIDFAAIYGNNMDIAGVSLNDTVIYSRIEPTRWASATISVVVMVLLAGAYPAFKVARLSPTEAMRSYR